MTPEELARRIFGERAACYAASAAHRDPQVLARLVELAAPRPDWIALDVATGAGHTAFAIAPRVARVVATDLTPQMIREALRLGPPPNVHLQLCDVHRLPYRDGAFELVASRRAPHHFSRIGRALDEMARVLARGGRLVIDDRSVPEDDFADRTMNRLDLLHDASHVRQYRPSEWRRMLEERGFVVEALEPYTKHRPLSSLTEGVAPDRVREIRSILGAMTPSQRALFDLREAGGVLHCTHWYVMIAARKP